MKTKQIATPESINIALGEILDLLGVLFRKKCVFTTTLTSATEIEPPLREQLDEPPFTVHRRQVTLACSFRITGDRKKHRIGITLPMTTSEASPNWWFAGGLKTTTTIDGIEYTVIWDERVDPWNPSAVRIRTTTPPETCPHKWLIGYDHNEYWEQREPIVSKSENVGQAST